MPSWPLKIMASTLIVLTTTSIGFDMARRYRQRPQHLRQLQSVLQGLATEISYGATPLPEAFANLANSHPWPAQILLDTAASLLAQPGTTADIAWQAGLDRLLQDSPMLAADLLALRQLGPVLGLSDSHDQERHLLLALQHLQQAEAQAEQQRVQNERMWRYLGVLSGLMLVIILL